MTRPGGSTIAFLRAILEAAGKRVHAYTSPHLVRFNERFRIGKSGEGKLVSDEELIAAMEECELANAGAPITVFEITTAAGLILFARHPADVLLMEVGLGGRLDATNVVDSPLATIITRVSVDHTDFLGDSLEKIAAEKAGILKRGVPAVIASQHREVLAVIERQAAKLGAPLGDEEVALTKKAYGWDPAGTFVVPDQALAVYRRALDQGKEAEGAWQGLLDRYGAAYPELAAQFTRAAAGQLPEDWDEIWRTTQLHFDPSTQMATREAQGKILDAFMPRLPLVLGGSADLTPSNNTRFKGATDFSRENRSGRYIRYGVREHAMGAAVGLAQPVHLFHPVQDLAG